MKTIKELESMSLVELAENRKEYRIHFSRYEKRLRGALIQAGDVIKNTNILQWWLAIAFAWLKKQDRNKVVLASSVIVMLLSLICIVIMTKCDVELVKQMWAVVIFAVAGLVSAITFSRL
jgi:membrane-associated HD superfamily phosphohydrolase